MLKIKTTLILLFLITTVVAQKQVAITIDDVPNTRKFQQDNFNPILLNALDSLEVPVTIFINEVLIYKNEAVGQNFMLLNLWFLSDSVSVANHTFGHSRYSEVGIDSFKTDILKGGFISKELSVIHKKPLEYFRFPYNDMGKDSVQHFEIRQHLSQEGYQIAPFTIESSDWMFNSIYEYFLSKEKYDKAAEIGENYIQKTLEYFDYFEAFCNEKYGRPVKHIYLCHDNSINADYLPQLISELKKKEYNIISMEHAMTDPVYAQEDIYFKKWGISWLYRWMTNKKERLMWMRAEPSMDAIIQLHNQIQEEGR